MARYLRQSLDPTQGSKKKSSKQNLWVRFGSGRPPRLCKRASFATSGRRKPNDSLGTSLTLLLRSSIALARIIQMEPTKAHFDDESSRLQSTSKRETDAPQPYGRSTTLAQSQFTGRWGTGHRRVSYKGLAAPIATVKESGDGARYAAR